MQEALPVISITVVSIAFLAVIALLGVVAIVHGQGDLAKSTLDVLRDWVKTAWKK